MAGHNTPHRATLSERLEASRRRLFVGRDGEQALWRSALEQEEPAFAVLWIVGAGGVGKSSLLARMAEVARASAVVPVRVDARELASHPRSFLGLLSQALGVEPGTDLDSHLHDGTRRAFFVDTAEQLGPVETWLRRELLPSLPARQLFVVASRNPPDPAWRSDAGWGELLRVVTLHNLSPDESRAFLRARGVDATRHERLLLASSGLPLALTLMADVLLQHDTHDDSSSVAQSPDVVSALLQRFAYDAPDDDHRMALYAAAHVRVIDEGLLRHAVEPLATEAIAPASRARALYDWLLALSFSELGPEGLHLHDLAALALDNDLRLRDPARYRTLHRRLREPGAAILLRGDALAQQRAATDLVWMHRFSPVLGALVDWPGARSLYLTPLTSHDLTPIIEATRRFEGEHAAELAAHWLHAQPGAFQVVRASPDSARGFICSLRLPASEREKHQLDPRVAQAFAHTDQHGPLRPNESLQLLFWLDYETHLDPGLLIGQVSVVSLRAWLGQPAIAWSFNPVQGRLDVYAPLMAYLDHHPAGRVDVGNGEVHLFAHDWRAVDRTAFLDLMSERELHGAGNAANPGALTPPSFLVLSKEAFAEAVRDALRAYTRPDILAESPLLRCRLVRNLPGDPSVQLRELLATAVVQLSHSGKDERMHAALKLTYLDPSRTQDEAAELLRLPLSTYRRHLRAGLARVVDSLWRQELHGRTDPETSEPS